MRISYSLIAVTAVCLLSAAPTFAGGVSIINTDVALEEEVHTHPPLRITPDKSELVRLPREAVSIIVGNPAHMSVLAESSNTLVIVPKAPGASHYTALDADGNVIIQQHVIIASPKKNYIRVRRSCSQGDESCQDTSVYYCPDMCHKIDTTYASNQTASAAEDTDELASNEAQANVPTADGL